MSVSKFITPENLARWAGSLAGTLRVYAPASDGAAVNYRRFREGDALVLDRLPAASPKKATFPQTETLLTFRKDELPGEDGTRRTEISETLPEGQAVVIGSRPCGARGKAVFDKVFDSGKVRDPYYTLRRDNTLFVSLACTQPDNTCFCTSVGGGPADTSGSDVLLVPVEGGYVAEAVTEAGEKLLENEYFEGADGKQKAAGEAKESALNRMGESHDYSSAPAKIRALFDNLDFWEKVSAKCLNCGVCTYLCPTCHCFNITDEQSGLSGRRIRTWDTCMGPSFTLEASGHNPRPTGAHRMRNRIGHKFSYYPDLHEKFIACCGCGRCIRSCPVSVDIRAVVRAAQEHDNDS